MKGNQKNVINVPSPIPIPIPSYFDLRAKLCVYFAKYLFALNYLKLGKSIDISQFSVIHFVLTYGSTACALRTYRGLVAVLRL